MTQVRLGVIGCGTIGTVHLRYAKQSPLIDVVAVADVREEAARQAAQQFGVRKVFTTAEALLDDPDVQAVVLAMPTVHRTALGLGALAKGKHLLTEKPVAMNAGEVRQLIKARGKLVAACCSCRFSSMPSAKAAREFLQSCKLGAIRVMHCRAIHAAGTAPQKPPPPWRLNRGLNGGGIFVNWGCYDLDYLLAITGWSLKPRTVLARTWNVAPHLAARAAPESDAETHLTALILCDSGVTISYERGEFAAAATENAWQIIGERGSLRLNMVPGKNKTNQIIHDDTTAEGGVTSTTLWSGQESNDDYNGGPVRDFAAAILEKRKPLTTLENALLMQKITDAVYASAGRGAAVKLR